LSSMRGGAQFAGYAAIANVPDVSTWMRQSDNRENLNLRHLAPFTYPHP
jgi:hypothetical protein